MKAFDYFDPPTVGDALAALAGKSDRVRPLAGGTDLIVQLLRGALEVDGVVDVKKIPELNGIVYHPGEGLTIGAAVPCHRIVEHADIVKMYPGLVDAVALIGGNAVPRLPSDVREVPSRIDDPATHGEGTNNAVSAGIPGGI